MLKFLGCISLLSAPLCSLASNSVTVTATRNVNLAPDQVAFVIYVNSSPAASLSDVLTALAGSPITIANFAGVSTQQNYQPDGTHPAVLQWSFGLPAAVSKIKDTTTMLSALMTAVTQNNSGLTLSFQIQNTGVSLQAQQAAVCAVSDLLSDARAQAQKLADAGGLALGAVLNMSSSVSSSGGNGVVLPNPYFSQYQPGCSLTVKFALTH